MVEPPLPDLSYGNSVARDGAANPWAADESGEVLSVAYSLHSRDAGYALWESGTNVVVFAFLFMAVAIFALMIASRNPLMLGVWMASVFVFVVLLVLVWFAATLVSSTRQYAASTQGGTITLSRDGVRHRDTGEETFLAWYDLAVVMPTRHVILFHGKTTKTTFWVPRSAFAAAGAADRFAAAANDLRRMNGNLGSIPDDIRAEFAPPDGSGIA